MLGGAGGPAFVDFLFLLRTAQPKIVFFFAISRVLCSSAENCSLFLLISERYSRVPGTELRATPL